MAPWLLLNRRDIFGDSDSELETSSRGTTVEAFVGLACPSPVVVVCNFQLLFLLVSGQVTKFIQRSL